MSMMRNRLPAISRRPLGLPLSLQRISAGAKSTATERALIQAQARLRALRRENERLQRLAMTDDLTGAYNRRYFAEMVGAALSHRERDGAMALCLIDVDDFKRVNDLHGHCAGDEMLRRLSRVLRREGDELCRLGGDEFAAIVLAHSEEAAVAHARRMVEAIRSIEPMGTDAGPLVITVTIGIAWVAADAEMDWEDVFKTADQALYRAKQSGKNGVASSACL